MTQANYTMGPWAVFPHYCADDPSGDYSEVRLIGLGQFDTIAEVRHGHDDLPGDLEANARIIAAAPELLEALEAMVDEWRDYARINNLAGTEDKHNMKLAAAAIAKAKGGDA